MLKELALKWFEKNKYNTALLRKIAKIANIILYLITPFVVIKRLFDVHHKPIKYDVRDLQKFKDLNDLIRKDVLYKALVLSVMDEYGFIETKHCDSLLFTSLLSASIKSNNIDIRAAQNDNGAWFRRPLKYPPCKGSTISRDMLTGLLWHIWMKKDVALALNLQYYGEKNDWVMGEGDISRLYFGPGLRSTLDEIVAAIYDGPSNLDRHLPLSWPKGLEDYEAHLAMLHIELRGQIKGYITTSMRECLKDIANRMERNALAQLLAAKWVHGDYSNAIALLQKLWPNTKLPDSKLRKEGWITQRGDDSSGWSPSEDEEITVHSGGDFLFCMMILRSMI
jgi:hypothetical protein